MKEYWGTVFFVCILAIIVLGLMRQSQMNKTKHCIVYTIEKIGGCDAYGYCGVQLSGGNFNEAHLPVVGQLYEVCK